ncbi:Caudovirus prohead protease [Methyloligella halotolerans]|uniref:Caudovirus prohead protease n=1 Tax=Methyloligella halotolerans TaxID=1177755 RepID=A0A1E2RXG5_9HYPH|nr:HK97 family phage prohead protease [Methyloligella halotolerans]ODA66842.1 Caudovirus prohead protease [Methyloligella halotolerans]
MQADGTFSGYASLFGRMDLGRDLVMPGAFAESLRAKGARGIKLLFQHNPDEPIGVWVDVREDTRGLLVHGRLLPGVARAREVLELMRAGALDGLSIGFRTVKGRTEPKSGIRRLDKIDLWEISIVTFPMLADARVSFVKRQEAQGEHAGQGPPGRHVLGRHVLGRQDLGRDQSQRLAAKMRRAAFLLREGSTSSLPRKAV